MASIEFITKRIEGKKKEIAKLESKLSRIEKAKASNWENNPYYYGESDLKWTTRDLETARAALAEYEKQLIAETEKAGSRNIPAIVEFLEGWKERVKAHYNRGLIPYFEEYNAVRELYRKYVALPYSVYDANGLPTPNPERQKAEKEYNAARDELHGKTNGYFEEEEWVNPWGRKVTIKHKVAEGEYEYLRPYNEFRTYEEGFAKLTKDVEQEADRKYDFIVERVNAICGTITDATGLKVGAKGDLNGFIIGERGTAKVQTIGAGGYNIQCFHFRTLIHEMK